MQIVAENEFLTRLIISGAFQNFLLGNLFQTLIMSMHKTTLALAQHLRSVHMKKSYLGRRITRCCTTGNPPLEVAPGQRKTHVNSYRCQTVDRGKIDPGVSELPRGNELSRNHVNRPLGDKIDMVQMT